MCSVVAVERAAQGALRLLSGTSSLGPLTNATPGSGTALQLSGTSSQFEGDGPFGPVTEHREVDSISWTRLECHVTAEILDGLQFRSVDSDDDVPADTDAGPVDDGHVGAGSQDAVGGATTDDLNSEQPLNSFRPFARATSGVTLLSETPRYAWRYVPVSTSCGTTHRVSAAEVPNAMLSPPRELITTTTRPSSDPDGSQTSSATAPPVPSTSLLGTLRETCSSATTGSGTT